MKMRLKELESILQQADSFINPKVHLEQYVTSAHIASHMLYTMQQTFDDIINDGVVADFGCGCGVLSLGCAVLGVGHVFGMDIDSDALDTCLENITDFELESNISLIKTDIVEERAVLKRLRERKVVDIVVMNPPFGTKNNSGIDMKFLQTAITLANHAVYSLHKSSTRAHVIRQAQEMGCSVEVVAELRYDLPKTYKFHKRQSLDVEVDFIRCEKNV